MPTNLFHLYTKDHLHRRQTIRYHRPTNHQTTNATKWTQANANRRTVLPNLPNNKRPLYNNTISEDPSR